jgi:signal peptidase I
VFSLLAQAQQPNQFADFVDKVARTPLSQVVYFVAVCTAVRLALYPFLSRKSPHQRGGGYAAARILNETLDAIVYAGVFVFLLIRPFGIQAFKIPTGSMLQTLQINDFIVANKAIYRYTDPKFGDIVVFKPPKRGLLPGTTGDVDYIKRCIGTPGDLIEIKAGVLYRNGQAVNEPYVAYLDGIGHSIPEEDRPFQLRDFRLVEYEGRFWPLTIQGEMANADLTTAEEFRSRSSEHMAELLALPPAKVPPGHYLMMGDNRFNSFDGRGWGLVPRDDIIGRSEFVWFPPSRWGATR